MKLPRFFLIFCTAGILLLSSCFWGGKKPYREESVCLDTGTQSISQEQEPPLGKKTKLGFIPPAQDFTIIKRGHDSGPILLVVGGIQGDEPGGFSAAALLSTHYAIDSGAVWIVPDLNFPSILSRSRGDAGDMNRKFSSIQPDDPDYNTVTAIKQVLTTPEVELVLNLHDGSGFYRPTYEDKWHNPNRWGQCVIIDQDSLEGAAYPDLHGMAAKAASDTNQKLLKTEHFYHVLNTKTSQGNKEMAKTLSYFVVRHGKAAFGVEASKNFTTQYRTYYHLLVIESFMRQMGIEFTRSFDLTPGGVLAAMNSDLIITAFNDKVVLPLDDARPNLRLVPFQKNTDLEQKASRPLLSIVPEAERWRVAYGNRTLTRLDPLLIDFDDSLTHVPLLVDGEKYRAAVGEIVYAHDSFKVLTPDEYRVNAIGALKEGLENEAHITIHAKDFMPAFSVDKAGQIYRVEIYRGDAFSGMILVDFSKSKNQANAPLTASEGAESDLGF